MNSLALDLSLGWLGRPLVLALDSYLLWPIAIFSRRPEALLFAYFVAIEPADFFCMLYIFPLPSMTTMRRSESPVSIKATSCIRGGKATAKTNESWDHIQDLGQRKKVQNRIAQRSYRKYTSLLIVRCQLSLSLR